MSAPDTLLYVLSLNRGRVSLGNLRAIARRRGLRCGRMDSRRILVAIYWDMVELDGVVRFSDEGYI